MNRKLIKNIKKIRIIIEKNKSTIKKIIVSEDFLDKIAQVPKEVVIDSKIDKETESEEMYLYNIQAVVSRFVKSGCILETYNGEYIVLKL